MEALYSDSDWESYSENSDNEDRYGNESMFGNHARSILSSLDASIRKIDDFLSLDRSFEMGDFVCLNSDQSGQIGKVVKVDITIGLEDNYGQTIHDIEGKSIIRISTLAIGDYVVNQQWLGKIDEVFNAITVLFDDGSKCITNGEDLENAREDVAFPPFVGQRVRMKRLTLFDSARKLCGGRDEGTISQIEVRSVLVNWVSPIIIHSSIPHSFQDPKDLTPLRCHDYDTWKIGDCCKFQNPQEMANWRNGALDCPYVITKMKIKLKVLWQEGQLSENIDPEDLLPVNIVDHDFWPGDIVLEKALNEGSGPLESQRFGVVKCVNAPERTVKVNWISALENLVEETVSAYELFEHPDYNYHVGEIVLKQGDRQVHDNSEYLSCIGIVAGLRDGDIEVRWANGIRSQVRCTEIYRVDRIVAISTTPSENHEETDLFPTSRKGFWNVELDTFPRAVSGFLTNLITALFGQRHSYALSSTRDSGSFDDNDGLSLMPLSLSTNCLEEDLNIHNKTLCETNEENRQSDVKIDMFKQFDVSDDYSDHHFINRVVSACSEVGRGWSKKIQQEWKVLEEHLPDTIYVKVYEERMDLMRTVIIGAPGTPYHDGLFFFDLYLPPDYPNEPPAVHYHSGGLRLNPNLYESGKVCLSLLKTWTGTESEVWDPKKSTILQLLLSLQALVLNDKPYFNEAGFERQVGSIDGERNAITYNENAFLLTCRSMLYLLKKPPKGFEAFVREHFRRQATSILAACEGHKNGSAWSTGTMELTGSTGFKIMLEKLLPRLQEGFAEGGTNKVEVVA